MSYLTLDADRLVRDAVDAYLESRLRPDSGGDCVYATRNSQYRVVEGVVHEASDTSLVTAELVGWLVEELGQPMIEPRWRPFGRAIFVERASRHVVVTSRTLTRNAISGNVSPVPTARRRPSIIPPSPPIPVLRPSSPPYPDGSPTPFRMSDQLRDAALRIDAQTDHPPDANERPTGRPPPEEHTVAADRASYEELAESTRTPALYPHAGGPPAPARPIQLPPVAGAPRQTYLGAGPVRAPEPLGPHDSHPSIPTIELEPDDEDDEDGVTGRVRSR